MADSGGNSSHTLETDEKPSPGDAGTYETSTPVTPKVKYDRTSTEYDMSGDRLMYIFNHEEYEDSEFYKDHKPRRRYGTEFDMQRLKKTFSNLKFKIDPCEDFSRAKIFGKLQEISGMDHSNTSCVAIAIMTHGEEGGKVYAADQMYGLLDVFDYVMHEPRLAGKPKLFFIQACSGDQEDLGHRYHTAKEKKENSEEEEEEEEKTSDFTIPTYSDCLVMMAAFDGFISFRDLREGSWMIQALCDVLDNHHQEEDILHMVTMVNELVAEKIDKTKGRKQIPETRYTLTKLLEFKSTKI